MFSADRICATISCGRGSIETTMGFSSAPGFLQRLELAVKQASRHEMLVTGGDAARDQLLVTLEINQTDVGHDRRSEYRGSGASERSMR